MLQQREFMRQQKDLYKSALPINRFLPQRVVDSFQGIYCINSFNYTFVKTLFEDLIHEMKGMKDNKMKMRDSLVTDDAVHEGMYDMYQHGYIPVANWIRSIFDQDPPYDSKDGSEISYQISDTIIYEDGPHLTVEQRRHQLQQFHQQQSQQYQQQDKLNNISKYFNNNINKCYNNVSSNNSNFNNFNK
ncbi:hypothetical protein HELRODRAFT_175741 [Helobdella robusta]|uniref:Uncharacterized protein n=1 Tax=Helobdella robusta TaxID=6412 RepID=T1F9M1_HELRO|nr:hypothetical protein HELRODRAFT_175741 [Helobdella robusta]ESO00344.1 hypothetical protein HELRODRAFT_175741 [Helobdella robusta]